MDWPRMMRIKSAKGDAMKRQYGIKEIIIDMDMDMGILITAKKGEGISMGAAGKDIDDELLASQIMSKISDIIFRRGGLAQTPVANKYPL
jgi:hypothetical protein